MNHFHGHMFTKRNIPLRAHAHTRAGRRARISPAEPPKAVRGGRSPEHLCCSTAARSGRRDARKAPAPSSQRSRAAAANLLRTVAAVRAARERSRQWHPAAPTAPRPERSKTRDFRASERCAGCAAMPRRSPQKKNRSWLPLGIVCVREATA